MATVLITRVSDSDIVCCISLIKRDIITLSAFMHGVVSNFRKLIKLCGINTSIIHLLTIIVLYFSEVGDVVGVADSTIRQSYRLLYPAREELFPTDFKFVTPLDQLPKH